MTVLSQPSRNNVCSMPRYVRWLVALALVEWVVLGPHPPIGGFDGWTAAGRISGIVMTSESNPVPVRRAIVSAFGSRAGRPLGFHAVTDEDGHFELAELPPDQYSLSAFRPSYVSVLYGASRPGWPGTRVVVQDGGHVADLKLLIARGAVITGIVRDAIGEPAQDLEVRLEPAAAFPTTAQARGAVRTDDRGEYRFFGLPAGSYIVSAHPSRNERGDMRMPADEDVDSVLRRLMLRQAPPNVSLGPTPGSTSTMLPGAPTGNFVSIYHPSGLSPEEANVVTLRSGEERRGVDIDLKLASTVGVGGRVVSGDSQPVGKIQLMLTRAFGAGQARPASGVSDVDGSFMFPSVASGRYVLSARVLQRDSPAGLNSPSCRFGVTDLQVTNADLTGTLVELRPCLRIDGRIEVGADATTEIPSILKGLRLRLQPDPLTGVNIFEGRVPTASISDRGTFALGADGNLMPGKYQLHVDWPAGEADNRWVLQSAIVNGLDILDVPLELTADSPTSATLVLKWSDTHTTLSGVLSTSAGLPATEYTMIVFPTNREWWRAPFRRVRAARPATTGEYRFGNLPPGEYYLAAVTEVAPDEWRDPAFLAEIAEKSLHVRIELGQRKVQDVQIRGHSIGSHR